MKLKMSKEVDLGKEPIGHLLFVLAVPSIISQVVNALLIWRNIYHFPLPRSMEHILWKSGSASH